MFADASPPATASPFQNDHRDLLREVFPDKESVLIYPDDFVLESTGDGASGTSPTSPASVEKNIILEDLVNRATGHFSDRRVAVLFRPGTYHDINFPVGYWTQVLGLGERPQDVTFTGKLGVYALPANTEDPKVGSLDTFWRSAENFQANTTFVQDPTTGKWCVPILNHGDQNPASTGRFYPVYDLATTYSADQVPNFSPERGMLWAVSQAAPLRRIQIGGGGNLHLALGDHRSSGGFMSNVDVSDGYLLFGSQQQFCVRNSHVARKAAHGAWSFVLIGCNSGVDDGSEDENATRFSTSSNVNWVESSDLPRVTYESETETRIEKPFIFIGLEDEKLYLAIPGTQKRTFGVDHTAVDSSQRVQIEAGDNGNVRVFTPNDSHQRIQAAADKGNHIVFNPGTYYWNKSLSISSDNQVVLGIGLATIRAPNDGSPCIHVLASARGVRISGLSLEANAITNYSNSTLLLWGREGSGEEENHSTDNPSAIHDLFCFVGGRSLDRTVGVETMVKIYSSNVIGDNLWLWRADHVNLMPGEQPNKPDLSEYHVTTYGECPCDVGLEVYGDNVTIYGLAVEHTYTDMLKWYGKHGKVFFYQSELPYDVSGDIYRDFVAYRVHEGADRHVAKGVGVYSYFRDYDDVVVDTAVLHQAITGSYKNVFTVWLDGYRGIKSVINGLGHPSEVEPGKPCFVRIYEGGASSGWLPSMVLFLSSSWKKWKTLFSITSTAPQEL